MASLVIASVARKIARRPADARMTFDYGRIEIVAALINYPTLILIGIYLIYEGGMRMIDPPEVAGWTVVILGGVALVIDTLTAGLTYSMQKGSVNIRALFLHNLSDALASVAVIAGGTLILLYDLRWVDPAVTIDIALYILNLALTDRRPRPHPDARQPARHGRRCGYPGDDGARGRPRRAPCPPVANAGARGDTRLPCRAGGRQLVAPQGGEVGAEGETGRGFRHRPFQPRVRDLR